MTAGVVALVALAATLVVTPLAMAVARRTGVMDHPGDLKSQAVAFPYLGGIGVFAGLAVGVLGARPTVLIPMAGALVTADDRFDLPPLHRIELRVPFSTTNRIS